LVAKNVARGKRKPNRQRPIRRFALMTDDGVVPCGQILHGEVAGTAIASESNTDPIAPNAVFADKCLGTRRI